MEAAVFVLGVRRIALCAIRHRAIRCISCNAEALQEDAASIPHAGVKCLAGANSNMSYSDF